MSKYVAEYYIDSKTLEYVTQTECPKILNEYIADILIDALGINGTSNLFCKCNTGGYNLSWILENGDEYMKTFSEDELLASLKNKIIDYEIKVK